MKTIELSQGKVAMVDDEDFEGLNKHKWNVEKQDNRFYAKRSTPRPNQTTIKMHRIILDTPKGMHTDHIDGNGLNNCKSNLRVVTNRQNGQNRHENKSSAYPGVSWNKYHKKWKAQIQINGTGRHLGYFKIETEAYNAYLKALEDIGEVCVNEIVNGGEKYILLQQHQIHT